MYSTITRNDSEILLANFIAKQLGSLVRHNFFLRFIKNTLSLLNSTDFSILEGIKIKIKGRFNKAPRARLRIMHIGKKVPVLTLIANICYAESIAFTSAGTFGVKVWLYRK